MTSFKTIDRDQLDNVLGGVAAKPTPKLKPIGTRKPAKGSSRKLSPDLDPIVKYDGWGAYIGDW